MGLRIDYKQIQDLTGKTYKTIKKRIDESGLKSVGNDGKSILYDSAEILELIYRDKLDTGENYREKLTEEQWREKKRDNDIAEGEIAPVSILRDALVDVGTKIVSQLEALPLEMKRANPRLTGHDVHMVKKSIARCCNIIAETKIVE
jgi:phage terminase Nu1 subunit (DNA packaging protein)